MSRSLVVFKDTTFPTIPTNQNSISAGVAQWQSSSFVMSRLQVRFPSPAPKNLVLRNEIFLSIAKAMVYHHTLVCISSPKAYIIRRSLYNTFAMMIYKALLWWYAISAKLMIYTPTVWFFRIIRNQCNNPERAYWENCGVWKWNHRRWEIPMRAYILQVCGVDECINLWLN